MKKLNKKGFTLAELLIVVAIIAILVAIAIPVFTKQLEKSRDTTSMANLRSAFAEATVAVLDGKSSGNVLKVTGSSATVGKVTILSTDEYLSDDKNLNVPFNLTSDATFKGWKLPGYTPRNDKMWKIQFTWDVKSDACNVRALNS